MGYFNYSPNLDILNRWKLINDLYKISTSLDLHHVCKLSYIEVYDEVLVYFGHMLVPTYIAFLQR